MLRNSGQGEGDSDGDGEGEGECEIEGEGSLCAALTVRFLPLDVSLTRCSAVKTKRNTVRRQYFHHFTYYIHSLKDQSESNI